MHAAVNGIGADGARALATSLEKNTTLVTLDLGSARLFHQWLGRGTMFEMIDLESARLCARWLGRGTMWRGPTAGGGRARARARCRARLALVQLGGGARVRCWVPFPGAWLLLVGA